MMEEIKLWIDLAGVAIEVLLLAYFMHTLLGPMRCKWYVGIGVYIVLGGCLWAVSYNVPFAFGRTIGYLLVVSLLLAAMYTNKIWTNMFAAFSIVLLSALLDYIVHAFLMLTTGDVYATGDHDLEDYILGLSLSKWLLLVLTQILVEYLRQAKRKFGQLTPGNFGLLLFYPLVNMAVFFMLYRTTLRNDDLYGVVDLLVIGLLLLVSNIGVFMAFNKMRAANQLEQENALAKQQLDKQQQLYSEQVKKHQSLRAWNHEHKSTLVVIAGFIRSGEPQLALEYIEQAEEKLKQSITELTGQIALDAILDDKQRIAQDMQVKLEYTIGLFEPLEIETMDLVVVLANGLDNALEAAAKLDEPAGALITCSLTLQQGWLKIIITNPVAQRVNLTVQKLPTDKADPLRHGIGLTNVERMVSHYHGKLILKCNDDRFTFTALMPNERPVMT